MCNCNCNNDYPCGWSFMPSIYISADAPLDANGMSIKLKLGDGVYLNENGELCAIGGSGETGVDDVKVNGSSVVSNRIAVIDLTPYALSSVVQSQVDNLETKVETISAETTPYSGASGVVVDDHTISLTGGHIVNDVSADTTYVSGSSLLAKFDGNPSNVVWGKFGFINNRRILDSDYNNFSLVSGASAPPVPGGSGRAVIPVNSNYILDFPSGDTTHYGLVMVDDEFDSGSTNPVQNKLVKKALDGKTNGAYTIVALTQAEYDALAEKDENTVYMIKES